MIKRILSKVITLFTAAFGVAAALAWDEAVKSLIQYYYPFPGTGIEAKFTYAITVTGVAVIMTTVFAGLQKGED